MKYYVIAGEPSGDMYGSGLIKELKKVDTGAQFRCWGGDLMQAQGGEIVKHYRDLAFMGFVEVAKNIRTIFKNIAFCKEDILKYKPDVLVLVDYPGFNMRIAKWAKEQGIRVFYYIAPAIWAWHESRVHDIKKNVERLYAILPFEKAVFAKHNYDVHYFGHPLADIIQQEKEKIISREEFLKKYSLSEKPIIAVLPGSRAQELKHILPEMLKTIKHFPEYQFVIGAAGSLPIKMYEDAITGFDIKIVRNDTYSLMRHAHAGLIKSGTSTLEAGLFDLPEVLCYKGNPISIQIGRWVAKAKYICLINLILDKPAVKELIQQDLNEDMLVEALKGILSGPKRNELLNEYKNVQEQLKAGNVSAKIAQDMYNCLVKIHEKA
ncbi:MAG TPA: lipid-A-disaccharide synthase [Bacteroidia bacterium]|jgi:lipid-A-disaccharide synthase|nr:lipid-A-disaccharide synthase [Bacteroidia bacterium]